MHPDDIVPFETVTKDGFLKMDCIKDAMLEHGDKFGNNKLKYKYENILNVSIVHYSEIIPKEDREAMTINRCFDFCRTVPHMVFFGLNAGRDCYCTPYFKPMSGDGSTCDEVCVGDNSQMCGGKTTSDIYEMHSCDDTRSNLEDIITEVEDKIFLHLQALTDHVNDIADEGTWDANEMIKVFGAAGAPDTSAYMQQAKVYAGELVKTTSKAQKLIDSMNDPYDAARGILNRDFTDFDNIKVAENAIKDLKKGVKASKEHDEDMKALLHAAHPMTLMGEEDFNSTGAAAQYYPIMYFAEKSYQTKFVLEGYAMFHNPTTCTGNLLQIMFGGVADDCAHACDGMPGKCDGFQYFAFNDGMCFLFESILTVQQWTGCHQNTSNGQATAPFDAQCMGKLSRLEGVGGIAPREERVLEEAQKVRQGTGGCAHCLEKLEKFETRCYEYGQKCIGNQYDMELYQEWRTRVHGSSPPPGNHANSCERIGANNPGWCTWDWGRPGFWSGSGQWIQASQVCPQCGYCISNGKQSGTPSIPWQNEHWEGDPHYNYYYYYYY
jgi:hypothetical protein